ncbi:hypothetical protein S2091_4706 [Solimicrobium silvestre]|uniref:Chain length determinant protein n=2 Tax=Solimicrobium silvestre TaxID=2099400 RepID=A0A2S9GSB4_9BURK|nr:hypothetical protein S2091_4706 [Solimicrobium silvestre]
MVNSAPFMSTDPQPSIFSLLKRHIWRFAVVGIVCAAIALGTAMLRPLQWKADLLFQIGQVGNAAGILIDPNNVVQRIKFPGFAAQILSALNLPEDLNADPRSKLISSSFTASVVKGGSLINLSVNGFSKEDAIKNLQASFLLIEKEHEQLLTPLVSRLKKNLDEVNENISKIEIERQSIFEPISKINTPAMIDKKFSESIVLVNTLKVRDSELHGLHDQKNSIEDQLNPSHTFNTKIFDKIFVSFNPESRNISTFTLLGLLFGLIFAGIWAVLNDKELLVALHGLFYDSNEIST